MQKQKDDEVFRSRNRMATIIAFILLGCVFFFYLYSTKVRIDDYAKSVLDSRLELISLSVDASINDARRSIVAAAGDLASAWDESEDFDIVGTVDSIKGNYPFDVLEFVDADGINLMSGENRFDASDREYYKKGILGLSGVWINFNPKQSNEYLLDFYSPVFFKGKIVGVMVGALGSKASLEPLTRVSYLGHDCIGVLFDEDERAIAGSFGVDGELYADDIYDMFNLTAKDKELFSRHVKAKDGEIYSYEGERGLGIAAVRSVTDYGWGLSVIIPSSVLSSVYADFASTEMMTLALIIIIVFFYILFILGISKNQYSTRLKEDEDIIKGFSKVYHTVFMLDYSNGTARCLRTRDPMASRFDIKERGTVSIDGELLKYILAGADESEAENLEALNNPMYLATMLNDRDFFSVGYSTPTGGRSSIDIAYMKSDDGNNSDDLTGLPMINQKPGGERYLIGFKELD